MIFNNSTLFLRTTLPPGSRATDFYLFQTAHVSAPGRAYMCHVVLGLHVAPSPQLRKRKLFTVKCASLRHPFSAKF